MFLAHFRRREGCQDPLPEKKDLGVRIQELGYFGVELVTDEPELAFTIRCGTEGRALELARDLQARVLRDEDWSSYTVEVRPAS